MWGIFAPARSKSGVDRRNRFLPGHKTHSTTHPRGHPVGQINFPFLNRGSIINGLAPAVPEGRLFMSAHLLCSLCGGDLEVYNKLPPHHKRLEWSQEVRAGMVWFLSCRLLSLLVH